MTDIEKLILQIMALRTWYVFIGVDDGELDCRTFVEISGIFEIQIDFFHEAMLFD